MSDNAQHNTTAAADEPAFHDGADAHHGVGHIVPIKYLALVAGALLVLTWLTVAVMAIDLGEANIYIALAIAVVKASLVMLFFMHLWWDRAFNLLVIITSIIAVVLFIAFALTDSHEYQADVQTYRAAEELNADAKGAQDKLTLETEAKYQEAIESGEYDDLIEAAKHGHGHGHGDDGH